MAIVRHDIINLIPKNAKRVLSVGCGTGITEGALKDRGVAEVTGIEINENAADEAKLKLDKVIVGDVEQMTLPFEEKYFDCIIYADLLEHLKDPFGILVKHRRYLSDNGSVVTSIPNVRYYYVVLGLILGNWNYQARGVLDRTHLHFFTLKNIRNMFSNTGYEINKMKRNYRLIEQPVGFINDSLPAKLLAKINYFYILREFFTFQYLIVANKKTNSKS
ncbi:MAG: class I SAM-dependent methyltransferase [Elusimicrobia bacterium]|nr:class I SAM-dependent methyltransferase [Elusimicrobiota bacterium]